MQLRQKQRATYGHHGTSLGKSARRSPQTVSALQMEAVEKKRKKRKGENFVIEKKSAKKMKFQKSVPNDFKHYVWR